MNEQIQVLLEQFETIESSDQRPKEAPPGWLIFNAPRPLWGTITDDSRATVWINSTGPLGWHFSAVDPNDFSAHTWIKKNLEDQAVLVEYTPLATISARVIHWHNPSDNYRVDITDLAQWIADHGAPVKVEPSKFPNGDWRIWVTDESGRFGQK